MIRATLQAAATAAALVWAAPVPADIDARTQLTLDDMRTFSEVFARIQRDYVEETEDQRLLENAIRGMLSELDPHTAYLTRKQFEDLEADTRGRYGGVGIQVIWSSDDLVVSDVTPDSPADRAGLTAGDRIRAVGGQPVDRMTPPAAVESVRGEPGTTVRLTIESEQGEEIREVALVREVIRVESVEWRLFGSNYGYLRIDSFQTDTAESTSQALASMVRRAGRRLGGLVLDLRSNPGGVLNAAVGVADLFLESGVIVTTRGRVASAELDYSAGPEDELAGAPLVVLVDEGTASASEIVAGALQDHRRALVLGERTFGKGSVQTVLPLRNGGAIKLTTSRYYTPSGRSIQAAGIQPDIDVTGDRRRAVQRGQTPEARLDGHLSGELQGASELEGLLSLAQQDYPLYRALMLLRGVHLLGRAELPADPSQ